MDIPKVGLVKFRDSETGKERWVDTSSNAWHNAYLQMIQNESLTPDTAACVCVQASNVYGAVLPVEAIGTICTARSIPFVVDASQSAGLLCVRPKKWHASFTAMPGHKGLMGPQGTGLLLCREQAQPLRFGGTGSSSIVQRSCTER